MDDDDERVAILDVERDGLIDLGHGPRLDASPEPQPLELASRAWTSAGVL
jgi:hypothetical protein